MKKSKGTILKIILGLVLLFLYLPIVYTIVFSFNSSKSLSVFKGFSLKWYEKMFNSGEIMDAIFYTIIVAVLTTVISTVVGTITAIGMSKSKKVIRKSIEQINDFPIMNPEIVTAIGLLMFFSAVAIRKGFVTMLLAHIMFCIPYVILSIMPKLRSLDPNLIDAALDLGATPMQALWKVIIPEVRPGMISGFMLALTLSIDDFAVTVFTIGNQGLETLSTYIYADARKGGLTPELRPLSAIIFVVVLALLIAINYRAGKTQKKD